MRKIKKNDDFHDFFDFSVSQEAPDGRTLSILIWTCMQCLDPAAHQEGRPGPSIDVVSQSVHMYLIHTF